MVLDEFACAKFSAVWRLATGWRRFFQRQEVAPSTPARAKDESANRGESGESEVRVLSSGIQGRRDRHFRRLRSATRVRFLMLP